MEFTGIGFADESYGLPVTNYYFEEAVPALFHSRMDKRSWDLSRLLREQRGRALQVILTREGREVLLGAMSWNRIRSDLLHPERFNAELIGSGSEGKVYSYSIGGRELAVKLYCEETQKRINEWAEAFGRHYPEPDFTARLGFSRMVVKAFDDWPRRFHILSSLTEYAASHNLHVMELGPKLTVLELLQAVGMEKIKDGEVAQTGEDFIRAHDISIDDIRKLDEELSLLEEASDLLHHGKIGFLGSTRLQSDFTRKNILVRGFDHDLHRFDLILIDQGQAPVMYSGDLFRYGEEQQELRRAQEIYERFSGIPELRAFLDRKGVTRPEGR